MSFFDDGEETASRTINPSAATTARRGRPTAAPAPAPAAARGWGIGADHHSVMVRRRIAAGVAVVVLIVVVLLINGCLKSEKQQSLKTYNREVSQLAQESDAQVSRPLFTALTGSATKTAIDVQVQVDQLLKESQSLLAKAKGLSVPGEMSSAQRYLLQTFDMRVEGMTKIAALLPTALGGQAKQTSPKIAGANEIFLASDVVYSQRVAPLIQEALTGQGIHLSTSPTRFLPNIGWLESGDGVLPHHRPARERLLRGSGPRDPRQRPDQHERGDQHPAAGTDAQPRQRREQSDLHGDRGKHGQQPGGRRQGRRDGDRRGANSTRRPT